MINFTLKRIIVPGHEEAGIIFPSYRYLVAFQKEDKTFLKLNDAVKFAAAKIKRVKDKHVDELKDIYRQGIFTDKELQRSMELHRLIGECIAVELKLEITHEQLAIKEKLDK